MLEKIKKIKGINHNDFDDIINDYIEAAKLDLVASGVAKSWVKNPDKLLESAIINYVKSQIDSTNSEMYFDAYSLQKDHIRKCKKYRTDVIDNSELESVLYENNK